MQTFNEWIKIREYIDEQGQNRGIDKNALKSGMNKLMQFLKQRFGNQPISGSLQVHPETAGLNSEEIQACKEFGALPNGGIQTNVVLGYFNPSGYTTFRAYPKPEPKQIRF